jgi:hypothetical protein
VQFRSLSSSPYSKSAIEEARKCAATRYELALRSISEATHDGNHEGTSDDGNSRLDVSIIIKYLITCRVYFNPFSIFILHFPFLL